MLGHTVSQELFIWIFILKYNLKEIVIRLNIYHIILKGGFTLLANKVLELAFEACFNLQYN